MNLGRRLCRWFGAILVIGWAILANGSVNDTDLRTQYGGQILTLRQFYPGEHLHFDAAGKLSTTINSGAWTVYGQVHVQDIFLKDGLVHIRGQRLFLFFDPETKQLRDAGSVPKDDKAKKLFQKKKLDEWAEQKGKIEIEVECGVAQPEMADLIKVLNAVFLAPGEALTRVVPDFWKNYLEPKTESGGATHEPSPVARSGGVSAPHITYDPDPSYPELARKAGYEGVAILYVIVGQDGSPQNIRIARPAGMGLDEAAVSTVEKWRFDPARRDGKPVAVAVHVEVSFKLH
jgi:TonB family protein